MLLPIKKENFKYDTEFLALLILFSIYTVIGFFGYGNDNDTYLMLRTGRDMFLEGTYHPSRPPGYFITELVIGGFSLISGHVVTNIISSLFATTSLYFFLNLLKKYFSKTDALLIMGMVGLNPYFIIAASTSMGYAYSLFFILFGITLLTKRRIYIASVLFALAVSSRISHCLIIATIYCYFFYIDYKTIEKRQMLSLMFSAGVAGCLSMALYMPSFIAYGNTLGFLTYYIGEWDLFGHLSRFIYKNIYLIGLLPSIFIITLAIYKLVKKNINFPLTPELITGVVIFLIQELLFIKIPIEISHLLPILFVAIPLYVMIVQPRAYSLYILLGLTISYSLFFNIDLLDRKYTPSGNEAIDADIGLFLRISPVFADISKRESSRKYYFNKFDLD